MPACRSGGPCSPVFDTKKSEVSRAFAAEVHRQRPGLPARYWGGPLPWGPQNQIVVCNSEFLVSREAFRRVLEIPYPPGGNRTHRQALTNTKSPGGAIRAAGGFFVFTNPGLPRHRARRPGRCQSGPAAKERPPHFPLYQRCPSWKWIQAKKHIMDQS